MIRCVIIFKIIGILHGASVPLSAQRIHNSAPRNTSWFTGPSFSNMVGKELITTWGIGCNIGKEYRSAKTLRLVPEFGYSHHFGKLVHGIKYIPVEQLYFQIGPRYYTSKNTFFAASFGAHLTYRHYILNERAADIFNNYTLQFGYKVIRDARPLMDVGILYSHFRGGNFIMNYIGLRTQFYIK